MDKSYKLKLHNCKQVVCVSINQSPYKAREFLEQIHVFHNYSIVVDNDGTIQAVGPVEDIDKEFENASFDRVIDCKDYCALPGFVDCHTHALFYGDRSKEFQMKLQGSTYTEIYNEGLGIRFSIQSVRKATQEQLLANLQKYLNQMVKHGTTTVEVKSGYGLDAQSEVKMLRVIHLAKEKLADKIQVVANFCGAHAIPKGITQQEQTQDVILNQIPAVKKAMDQKLISPEFIDVFCEKKFFEEESTRKILQAGKKIGLIPAFHGDQLSNTNAGAIAAEVNAISISHLEYKTVQIMGQQNIAAVLLPTTQNIEKLPLPPIQLMREHGVIMALGSDFCPNAFCFSMQLTMHYGCVNYRMFPHEAISAATLNAAFALNRSDRVGSIEKHKQADIVLVEAENWLYVIYGFGSNSVSKVIKKGKVVVE